MGSPQSAVRRVYFPEGHAWKEDGAAPATSLYADTEILQCKERIGLLRGGDDMHGPAGGHKRDNHQPLADMLSRLAGKCKNSFG